MQGDERSASGLPDRFGDGPSDGEGDRQSGDVQARHVTQSHGAGGALPRWWKTLADPGFALAATVLPPMAVAAVPGFFIFRSPDKCACFAVLGRAVAAALSIWLVGGKATSGGTSALTDMQGFSGYSPDTPADRTPRPTGHPGRPDTPADRKLVHFVIAVVVLLLMALARQSFVSRYGELLVAVRDSEEQVRFLGHDPADVKLVAHVVAADMAGPSGVPAVGIVGPESGPRRTAAPLSSPASADAGTPLRRRHPASHARSAGRTRGSARPETLSSRGGPRRRGDHVRSVRE